MVLLVMLSGSSYYQFIYLGLDLSQKALQSTELDIIYKFSRLFRWLNVTKFKECSMKNKLEIVKIVI